MARWMLAGLGLVLVGCGDPLPMAVTVGHSPIAYTQPKAVIPVFVPVVPAPPPSSGVGAAPTGAGPMPAPSSITGPASQPHDPCAPGAVQRPGVRCEDPVVTVPAYTLPVYGSVGARTSR